MFIDLLKNCMIFAFNISYASEEYDKCIEDKTKEAGGEMDYVYQGVIIQLCKQETEDQVKTSIR